MNISWKACTRIVLTVLAAYLCVEYWAVAARLVIVAVRAASPLLIGGVIAYIVNILMSFYERKLPQGKESLQSLRRPGCMLLSFITLALVFVLLFRMILPELVNCIMLLMEKLPAALRSGYLWLDENFNIGAYLTDRSIIDALENLNAQDAVKKIADFLMSGVGGAMGSIVSGVGSVVSALPQASLPWYSPSTCWQARNVWPLSCSE